MPPPGLLRDPLLRPVLQRLQGCIHNNQYSIRDTRKNKAALAQFGWTIENQEEILLSLKPSECYNVDRNRNNPKSKEFVYKFHKNYRGRVLYIKITFRILSTPDNQSDYADIMSLHIDDYKQGIVA